MDEITNNLIIKYFGLSVFVIIALIVGIVFLTIWCYKIYMATKKINELPCKEHADKMDKYNDKMTEHDVSLGKIDTSITFLTRSIENAIQLLQKNVTDTNSFTQTKSPLNITPKGQEMIKRLGLMSMFEKNWPHIRELIDKGVQNKTAYDINAFCIEQAVVFPDKFLDNESIEKIKIDAYKNGLNLTEYMRVIAVLSREEYFKEKGIVTSDIEN